MTKAYVFDDVMHIVIHVCDGIEVCFLRQMGYLKPFYNFKRHGERILNNCFKMRQNKCTVIMSIWDL